LSLDSADQIAFFRSQNNKTGMVIAAFLAATRGVSVPPAVLSFRLAKECRVRYRQKMRGFLVLEM